MWCQPFGVICSRLLRADGLVDDLMQFFEQFGHVRGVAPFLQFLVDGFDVIVALGIREGRGLHEQGFKAGEHLPGHDLEAPLGFVGGVHGIGGIP